MKSKKTLVLAASILTLTLSAFPHHAAASTGSAPQQADSDIRKAGGTALVYITYLVTAGTLFSALLP